MKKTSCAIAAAIILGLAISVLPATGQTNSTWIGGATNGGVWSNASLWNPAVVPNGNYNVTVPWNPSGDVFNGPELDLNITVQNLTIINRVFLDNQSFPGTNLTVNGNTSITTSVGHDGETAAIFDDGGVWLFGTLANYNSATHTLTDGFFFAFNGGTIGWRGADIITNQNGTLIVSGTAARMVDQNNNLNAFRNIAVNTGGFTIADGYNFTTAGNFTNKGGMAVTTGDGMTTVFTIPAPFSLTNFNAGTHTLTDGYYDVEVTNVPGTATLRFPGADIWTLSDATLKLVGAGASIIDSNTSLNGLRNLSGVTNTTLTNAGTLTITPNGGTFTVDSSTHNLDNGANITISGNHHTTNSTITHVGNPNDGTQAQGNNTLTTRLTINGNSLIEGGGVDMGGQPGLTTQYHTELQIINGLEFRGAFLTGTGTTFADIGTIQFNQNSTLDPGHSPGELTFSGNAQVALDSSTTTKIQIGGYTAGVEFDRIVKAGGSMTLGGKLLIEMYNGFENLIRNSDLFDVISASTNLFGSFSNIASGARVATNDGKGTFIVTYSGSQSVRLSKFLPPPRVVDVTKLPGHNFTIYFLGYPNSTYDLQASPDPNPANFETIASLGTGSGPDYGVFATEDAFSGGYRKRFYRVVYPSEPPAARASTRGTFVRKG